MPLITSIQKYSIHDGDGIRTTVFFKGCPLSCAWCHNPETQSFEKELFYDRERCTGCGSCVEVCPRQALVEENHKIRRDWEKCNYCGTCTDYCLNNLRELAGKEYSVRELVKELQKDEMFYEESGGGVTLSGGEVMCSDMDFVEELVKKLHRLGISLNIDTCGFAPYEHFQRILPYVDTFLYDVKMIDSGEHKRYTGVDNQRILENLEKLNRDKGKISIRIPVIKEVNGSEEKIKEMIGWLKEHGIRPVGIHLLPYHSTGASKYERLGQRYGGDGFHPPEKEDLEKFAALFRTEGFSPVKIGG